MEFVCIKDVRMMEDGGIVFSEHDVYEIEKSNKIKDNEFVTIDNYGDEHYLSQAFLNEYFEKL